MSLVGSLDDLDLGDILQIVSLSRKSGLLMIHADEGEGRIVFCDGLVRAAFAKGEADDLRGLLVSTGFVDSEEFERAQKLSRTRAEPLDEIIPQCTELTKERLESLRREHVTRAVCQIFSWQSGEFRFEVCNDIEPRDAEIVLSMGINAQYLSMEATRMSDEKQRDSDSVLDEIAFDPAEIDDFASWQPDHESEDIAVRKAREVVVAAAAVRAGVDIEMHESLASQPPEPTPASSGTQVLVAIDADLTALEWQKAKLKDLFRRVHIFQSGESGVLRIRQYLARGEMPIAVVSDAVSHQAIGGDGIESFVKRLKQQAPTMPVLVTFDPAVASEPVPMADAMIRRPCTSLLGRKHAHPALDAAGDDLRNDMQDWLSRAGPSLREASTPAAPAPESDAASVGLHRLRANSERMRDPAMRGQVLSIVLEFASEDFRRVAIFTLRDDHAIGIAQTGLPVAGGPDDEAFCALEIAIDEVDAIQTAIDTRRPLCVAHDLGGITALTARLGTLEPSEAYLAPIESAGQVVALLYADQLPQSDPIGDTTILEIALHEAGLALERALPARGLAPGGDAGAD